jgi:DNA-binding transcriptional LysR family regulator
MLRKVVQPSQDPGYLQKLRTFCAAVRAGSFTRAGEQLALSQPTVSLHIQALERNLGTALFRRRGPSVSLTPDGQAYFDLAWPRVSALESLEATFSAERQGALRGRLQMAAGEATMLYLLPSVVKEFADLYPGVTIRLHNVSGREGLHLLRSDAVDLAVGSLIEVPGDISYEPVITYQPTLITPLGHPLAGRKTVSLREIARYPLILPPQNLATWPAVASVFQKQDLPYQVVLETGGWEVIKRYVESGLGISIVTSICLTGQEKLAAIAMTRYFPPRTYGLVLRKNKALPAAAVCFTDLLRRRLRPPHRPAAAPPATP